MILTEDEAKTKWCPMVRAMEVSTVTDIGGVAAAAINTTSPADRATCMGSGCMMWSKYDQIGIGPNGEKRDRDMDGRTRWVDRGYCALATPLFVHAGRPSPIKGSD
jgi:hypothetical protein